MERSGCKYFGLEIFRIFGDILKAFGSKFLVLRNACSVYLHVFTYMYIYRFLIFKLADGLKIHDIK